MECLLRAPGAPRALEIAKTLVAIPAWHHAGHRIAQLPTAARFDQAQQRLPFDIRDYPSVAASLRAEKGRSLGVWTTDLIVYDRAIDQQDLIAWILRVGAHWSEAARRALFWREARPLGILERLIAANIITDTGATALLKGAFNSAAPSSVYNHMQLSADAKTAQLSGAMASTGATAIPVTSGGTNFTSTMLAYLGYGTANQETVNIGSGSTATSVVSSATTKTHNANDYLVQAPGTQSNAASDNPSSVTSGYDSGALGAGAYTFSGSGPGNRQVQIVYDFPANSGAPGGGYTDLWMSTAATIAAGTSGAHLTRSPLLVNGSTGANCTYTDSL